jgi:hypothetical protein
MFDRVGNLAEKVATKVSRRDFYSWAGKIALALAGVVTFGGMARANGQCNPVPCMPGLTRCSLFCCPKGCKCCPGSYGGYCAKECGHGGASGG